ncbi:MAG: HAD family phosphatase [Bacteroidales bacterium]
MKEIKYIVFDFGGVITKKQNEKIINKMCQILNIPGEKFSLLYTKGRKDYDSGLIDARTYWTKIIKLIDRQVELKDIDKLIEFDIKSWLDINEETVKYIQSIRSKTNVALLSNMSFDTLKKINNLHWMNYLEPKILSCEEKVSKPDYRIYDICLKKLRVEPHYVLFIDDSEENVIAAQKMGINALKFTNCNAMKDIIENEYILSK